MKHLLAITIFAIPHLSQSATPQITMVDIPAGYFYMGGNGEGENFDESPVHKVVISEPFRMSATEITNAQYEEFDPSHRSYRGKDNVSWNDDEAVTNVSYQDAMAFCRWLGKKHNKNYRLPPAVPAQILHFGWATDFREITTGINVWHVILNLFHSR